jgi:acyl-CoA thioesterase FadM
MTNARFAPRVGVGGDDSRHVARVRSTVETRRRGLEIVFAQTFFEGGGQGERATETATETATATAEVTCVCLGRDNGRPRRCPPDLLARFGVRLVKC